MHAFAQVADTNVSVRDRARPDYDPQGLRFGGFDLNATLDLGVASTDNLFAAATGEQEDIVYHVSPNARLSSHWSRHALVLEAGADFKSHADFSTEDAETGYIGAHGRLDIGRSSQVSANARFAQDVEARTNPDALNSGAPVEFSRSELGVSGQHQFNRVRVRATAARAKYDYDGVTQDFRDSEETSFTGRLDAELTPRVGAVFEAGADERDYSNSPGLSSDGTTYLAGVSINFTDLMRGELAVGQFVRDYNVGGNVEGTAVAASLEWYITRLTTINLNARRNAGDSGATAASPYVETAYGARVDHELLRNVILTAGAQAGRREYEVINRDDEYQSVQIGGDYLLNRRVAIRGRLSHDENDSTNAVHDFEVNAVTLGLSLRL